MRARVASPDKPRRAAGRTAAWAVGAAWLAFASTACSSSIGDARPSPIPPGYLEALEREGRSPLDPSRGDAPRTQADGERLVDAVIASVGDRYLTRSEVLRRLRLESAAGGSGPGMEAEIERARVRWAQTQLLGIAARQGGLQADPAAVDRIARDKLKELAKTASEEDGSEISPEAWLAQRRLTWEEFRRQFEDEVLVQFWHRRATLGLGQGARPEQDLEVTPAEVRRIYREHGEAFDEPRSVRSAVFEFRVAGLADDDHGPAEWQALAERRADQLAQLFREGHEAAFLARRYGLDDEERELGMWRVEKEFVAIEDQQRRLRSMPELVQFLDRPELAARDALVLRGAGGPLVYGIVEYKPGRRLDFVEAQKAIATRIANARVTALRARTVISLLESGSVVSPRELEDHLLDAAQAALDQIAADDILRTVRLK